jgi:hypothetical protein
MLVISSDPTEEGLPRQVREGTIDVEIAAFLGIHHFNQRSGAVIPDLPDRLLDCDVYFTMDLRDTFGESYQSSRQVLDAMNMGVRKNTAYPLPTGIVGTGRSSTSAPSSVLGGVFQVPQVSCCATSREIDPGNAPFFARTVPTNQQDARAAAQYFSSLGISHVGVVSEGGSYGQQFVVDFRGAAEALGLTVISTSFTGDDLATIYRAIGILRDAEIRYVFGIFLQDDLSKVMNVASPAGLTGPAYTWIFSESLNRLIGESIFFDVVKDQYIIAAVNGSGVVLLDIPSNERFDQALGDFRKDEELQNYYISRHTSPELFDEYNLGSNPFRSTYFSQLNYDASVALGIAACESASESPTGQDIFDGLKNVEFTGSSGLVKFNNVSLSRSHVGLHFKVFNIVAQSPTTDGQVFLSSHAAVVIDFLSVDAVQTLEPFVYSDGTTTPHAGLPPPDVHQNLVSNAALAFGLALAGAMMLMSILWIVWAVKSRNNYMIRAAQPLFLVMLCIGAFIMASSIIPMSFQDPMPEHVLNGACMAIPWLVAIGFSTSFSALFSKLWRIDRVHRASVAFQRIVVRAHNVMLPFLILSSVNIGLLITWTVLSPMEWTRKYAPGRTDRFGRYIEFYGVCESEDAEVGQIFTWTLAAVNFVPLLSAVVQSYRTRFLPSIFNESTYVALSLLSMLEATIVGFPILWLVSESPTASFLVRAILVTIFCLAIILPIFVPKAKAQAQHHNRERRFAVHVSTISNIRQSQIGGRSSQFEFDGRSSLFRGRQRVT